MSFTPTTKTNEALQAALKSASAAGNPDIRPGHLLVALLEQPDGIAGPLLTAAGVEPKGVLARAASSSRATPPRSGSNMANPQFNRDALNALTGLRSSRRARRRVRLRRDPAHRHRDRAVGGREVAAGSPVRRRRR